MQNKHTSLEHLFACAGGWSDSNLQYPSVLHDKQECWVTSVAWCYCCYSHTHAHTAVQNNTTPQHKSCSSDRQTMPANTVCPTRLSASSSYKVRSPDITALQNNSILRLNYLSSLKILFLQQEQETKKASLVFCTTEKLPASSHIVSAWIKIILRPSRLSGEVSQKTE